MNARTSASREKMMWEPTGIEREPMHCFRTAETAILRLCFKDYDLLSFLVQEPGERKAGKAAPKNCCRHCTYFGVQDLYGSP